jgi:hypothetical protein
LMRRTLLFSVFYNLIGTILVLFPGSIGKPFGVPSPAIFFYSGFCAVVIFIYAGVYLWLFRRPEIDRPVVAIAAIGKAGFFLTTVASWGMGEVPFIPVLFAIGDLIMAGIFFQWLLKSGNVVSGQIHR